MVPDLFFYQLLLIALVWLCLMLHWVWPSDPACARRPRAHPHGQSATVSPNLLRASPPSRTATPVHPAAAHPQTPSVPPPRIVPTRGRRRQVDTSHHFCPNPDCAYRGWVGWGNLRANGHPSGGPWRQLLCVACRGYFLETLGTIFHGKRASVELIVRVIACLAEGLGIRGTARVFEVDPNTVLQWLVEAAEQLRAFSRHVLHDVRVRQVQLDELFALLSAVKEGAVSEAEAIERLERSPQWVWVAMDPESKLLLAIDVGNRTLAMAQRVVHQVAQVLAPDCAPLFLTDGFREYLTALLTHYGQWVQPPRRQAQRPRAQAALDAAARSCSMRKWSRPCGAVVWSREAPRRVWHAGGGPAGAGGRWLAHQHGVRGADQPHHPPACGGGRTTGHHAVQGRGRLAAAARRVPRLL